MRPPPAVGARGRGAPDGSLLALDAGTGGCRAALFTAGRTGPRPGWRDWSHRRTPVIPGSQSFESAANWER
jgi:sugar (pentulose or hexulose) kinase